LLAVSRLRDLYLAYFSKPRADRAVYRSIHRRRWHRFLEIGIGRGVRAARMADMALRHHPKHELRYVGIDLFEGRPAAESGLSLKQAYRLFKAKGIPAQFVPGDPFSALARAANSLRDIDLVVISADQDPESLDRAWFYLPRVLHATSVVFIEQANPDGTLSLLALDRAEVDKRARKHARRAA
jgi:hypothetical protein